MRTGWQLRLLLAPLRLVRSPLVQAFVFVFVGGLVGMWLGAQLWQAVLTVAAQQAAAATPVAVSMPVVSRAEASVLYTSTPVPTRTPVPTQTPQPILPGPQPDRYPAVSPFVFASREH